jgi:ubiquinone/menaquinone biosynthesis C-methylase UbiE
MTKRWLWVRIIWTALSSRTNQDFYDRISPIYDEVFLDHVVHAKNIAEYLDNIYTDQEAETLVLDLGCGTGMLGSLLEDKGYKVIGLDISFKSLGILRKRKPQLSVIQANANFLPMSDTSFSAVVCLGAWRHFPDFQEVLKEISRILTPDGVFIVGYFPPDIAGAIHVTQSRWGKFLIWLYQAVTRALGYQDQADFLLEGKTEEMAREQFKMVGRIESGLDKRLLVTRYPLINRGSTTITPLINLSVPD